MEKVISFLMPILVLGLGLLVMSGGSSLIRSPRATELVIFAAFVVFNVAIALIFHLTRRLKKAWGFRRVWHLPVVFLIGAIPIGTAYFIFSRRGELAGFRGLSGLSVVFTFVTVTWEELWFRGSSLELGEDRYGKIGAAIIFGAVFALLHVMNPKISLVEDGPQLFLAGYALSTCYFAFGSIWAPIGMHLANNSIQAAFGNSTEPRTLLYIGPLMVIAVALTIALHRQASRTTD